tara:strand:+ start:948 stop:1376 length:429 start_codon:yes stop_codon:yes gene_type:complete
MRRRKRSKGINVVNAAQSLIVANAATRAVFGLDVVNFLGGGWAIPLKGGGTNARPGSGNSWGVTAQELIEGTLGIGREFGMYGTWNLQKAIKHNLRYNGAMAVGTAIMVPAIFKVGKELTKAPRRDMNKLLKMTGLSSVVKV